jgi:photosystem II stability/assembly factor-like uncharacterized protein
MKANKFITAAALVLFRTTAAFAQTWTQTTAPPAAWTAIASSADGTKLFAASGGYVYGISTNSGATWTTITEPQIGSEYGFWDCIASSANGNTLVAMNYNEVWVSTNAGVSWISNNVPTVNHWVSVALSADGIKAVAVDGSSLFGAKGQGGIYTSTNSGMTWRQTLAPSEPWTGVASSADGTVLAATVGSVPTVPVYVSTNSGATWAPTSTPTNLVCYAIACSADGRKLIVADLNAADSSATGNIYTSTNFGNTWTTNNVPSQGEYWDGVATSADGTKLIAVSEGTCNIFTSTNSGLTWVSNSLPSQIWVAAASSADGAKLAAVNASGSIWTLQTTPSPTLNLTPTNGCLALSWTIPSANFVLQENADLTTTNWCNVTNPPVLNFTDLQYQVTLPAPVGNAFFRLTAL